MFDFSFFYFFFTAQRHIISGECKLLTWLEQWGLGHYFENFRVNELCDLRQVANIDLNDLDLFNDLEMDVPAHRKRLHKAGMPFLLMFLDSKTSN